MAELRVPNINSVVLSGRLTQDPELRFTPSGKPVSRLRLAVSRPFRNQSGEWQEDTLFIDVNVWGDQAERRSQRLAKGSGVIVEGWLRSRSWESETGGRRSVVEVTARRVHFLEKLGERDEGIPESPPEEGSPEDEDLPF